MTSPDPSFGISWEKVGKGQANREQDTAYNNNGIRNNKQYSAPSTAYFFHTSIQRFQFFGKHYRISLSINGGDLLVR